MMKKIAILIVLCVISFSMNAQRGFGFRVNFCDKNGTATFADSLQFLSQKSLDRRSNQGIALDSTDLPIVQMYIDSVMNVSAAVKLHNKSKWFNQIVVITYDSSKVAAIANLPFVCKAELVAIYGSFTPKRDAPVGLSAKKIPTVEPLTNKTTGDPAYYGLTYQQVNMLEADCLHDQGFRGEGMTIAVIDAGFRFSNTHTQFDSLNNSGRFLATYDFIRDTTNVLRASDHGTNVMGVIIGEDPGSYVGIAPKSNIYALMTEDVFSEQPIEEDNWLSAAEWADSAGADMINGSLGYNEFSAAHRSYTYSNDLDGNSTLIARTANMAVSKGIFTCVAQGNSGAQIWHYMLTPADADSAFSVGSVDGSGAWAQSGYGPNADGQTKPNGVALGRSVVLIGGGGTPGVANGSSFASPLIAGAVACLWQALPQKTESQIRHLVMSVSDRFTSPNNTHGFGIPNFCMAYNLALGTDEFENNVQSDFEVYPNPSEGSFTIRVKQAMLPYNFELYTMEGKKVSELSQIRNIQYTNSTLQNLPKGSYFIKLSSKLGEQKHTIINR